MWFADELPRAFFTSKGRGYNAHSSRNVAAAETALFIFYNHRGAATAAQKDLVIELISASTQNEAVDVILGRTTESDAVQDAIEALSNAGASAQPLYFNAAGGVPANIVFARSNGTPGGVTFSTFHRDHVNPDLANQRLTLSYPIILPPGSGLVVDFNDAAAVSRQDFVNFGFYRA